MVRDTLGEATISTALRPKRSLFQKRIRPAKYYVMIDDMLRQFDAIKRNCGDHTMMMFPRQAHRANDVGILTE